MAKDVADIVGSALGKVAREAVQSVSDTADKGSKRMSSSPPLAGGAAIAAGLGLAALAPVAAKRAGNLVKGAGQKAGKKVGESAMDAVSQKTGGVGGLAKEAGKSMIPGLGGGDDAEGKDKKSKGMPGVGKGRRMPVQQDFDIGVPVETVYEKWTDFEEWPKFMHRIQSVTQEDDENVTFKAKIWGISKEFKAEITEQQENELVKWRVTEGMTHEGIVTFHELGPRLTRVELNLDVQPGSLIEKAARGMRHVKRAARADMARFKAYVLMDGDDDDDSDSSSSEEQSSGRRSASKSARRSSSSKRSSGSGRGSTTSSSSKRSSSSNGRSRSTRGSGNSSSSNGRSRSRSQGRKRSSSRS
jgi:uncharacterized membrane protein